MSPSQVPAPCALCGTEPDGMSANDTQFTFMCPTDDCIMGRWDWLIDAWNALNAAISAHTEEKVRLVSRQHGDLRAEERHTYDKWAAERGREEEARTASAVSEATAPLVEALRRKEFDQSDDGRDWCSECLGDPAKGHTPGCPTGVALAPYGGSSDE